MEIDQNANNVPVPHKMTRREVLASTVAVAAAGAVLSKPFVARAETVKDPKDVKFVFSTPFSGQDSFSGQIGGLNKAVADFGGHLTIADAGFDIKKQNDQIASLVAGRPDALIVLPTDPVGVANALKGANEAGVPVFLMDSSVPGVVAVHTGMHNNYGMGQLTTEYLVKRLGGKGKIATMSLPINEAWDMRSRGQETVLLDYPDIKIVADWSFDPTGKTNPRSAADSFLTAHPDLDAIWCAWDDAAMAASLAILAAGLGDKVFTTGTDGGPAAFKVLGSGGPFSFSMAQSFFMQAYWIVYFAHRHLQGHPVPRFAINPVYAVTKEVLDVAGPKGNDYDKLGVAKELGWKRVL